MAVDDLWYLSKPGPGGDRRKSKLHGKGRRWRCRYVDSEGESRQRNFAKKADAEAFDLQSRTGGIEVKSRAEQAQDRQTFAEYAERWRTSRQITQALDYQRHTESRLRHHLLPDLGKKRISRISVTDVLEWIAGRVCCTDW